MFAGAMLPCDDSPGARIRQNFASVKRHARTPGTFAGRAAARCLRRALTPWASAVWARCIGPAIRSSDAT